MREIWEGKMWGNWTLEFDRFVLTYSRDRHWYEIDLERMNSSAQMLDWIFQVKQKAWATPETVYDLLQAFREIYDPQGTLCPWGCGKTLNATKHMRKLHKQTAERELLRST